MKSEIDDFSKKGDIIIGGDFNCRVGLLPDYVEEDNNFYGNGDPEQIIDNQFANRYSQGKTINSLRRNLIDLCLTRQLKIINGRTLGDLTGKFTCYKGNGNSVGDYIICSENLLHKVIAFKIKHITNFSDHCQLSLTIDIKAKNNKKEIALKSKNLQKGKPKYIWNEDSKHKLLKFFHGNLLNKMAITVKQTTNAEDKLKIINDLLISACNQCLKKQTRKSNANRIKQKQKFLMKTVTEKEKN